jgi:hypothetical protein
LGVFHWTDGIDTDSVLLLQRGLDLSDAALQSLAAGGVTTLREVYALNAPRAAKLGLSAEDARRVGALQVQPALISQAAISEEDMQRFFLSGLTSDFVEQFSSLAATGTAEQLQKAIDKLNPEEQKRMLGNTDKIDPMEPKLHRNDMPVVIAAKQNPSPDAVRCLVENGVKVGGDEYGLKAANHVDQVLIHLAAEENHSTEVMEYLIEAGDAHSANLGRDYKDRYGATLLHVAAESSDTCLGIVKCINDATEGRLLVETCHGKLPVHCCAAEGGCPFDALEYLVDASGKQALQTADGDGHLPIHCCASSHWCTPQKMDLLRAATGDDVLAAASKNNAGMTALELAVELAAGNGNPALRQWVLAERIELARADPAVVEVVEAVRGTGVVQDIREKIESTQMSHDDACDRVEGMMICAAAAIGGDLRGPEPEPATVARTQPVAKQ